MEIKDCLSPKIVARSFLSLSVSDIKGSIVDKCFCSLFKLKCNLLFDWAVYEQFVHMQLEELVYFGY